MRFFYEFFYVFFTYNLKHIESKIPFELALFQLTAAFGALFVTLFHTTAEIVNLKEGVHGNQTLMMVLSFFIYLYIRYLSIKKLKIDKETGLCEQYSYQVTRKAKIFYWSVFLGFIFVIPGIILVIKNYL